ncbi:MAG: sigma-54 interaction domain-containing protein [Planctomycetota bacterium]
MHAPTLQPAPDTDRVVRTRREEPADREPRRAQPLVGDSPAMRRLLEEIEAVGRSDARTLLRGESGTGKELVARMLCDRSPRRRGPFVAVNCAAFPEPLLEAELFGHERGAFSGAPGRRDGRFQAAHRGTLFLDEIAELPLAGQAKLLRVLETGAFEPLGTNASVFVDVRIISATHCDLRQRVAEGSFRADLYYRLRVVELALPPLRERPEDIPLLARHFLARAAGGKAQEAPELSDAALERLLAHDYPGNVRELEHALQHALVLSRGQTIEPAHLPREVGQGCSPGSAAPARPAPGSASAAPVIRPLSDALQEFERDYLLRALDLAGGRKAECAARLGLSRKGLWGKLRRYGIEV